MCSVVIVLVSCGGEREGASGGDNHVAPESTPEPDPTYRVVEVTDTGTIRGSVLWSGDLPEGPVDERVRVHREACGETQPSRALRVSSAAGIADAVVSLDIRRGAEAVQPEEPTLVDHQGCRFQPHVTAIATGWELRFRNSDEVLHNVHGFRAGRSVMDLGLPELGSEARRSVDLPGVIRLVCDAGHGWQQAWVHVFEHPYFAVTDERGRFAIPDVPPGQYSLRVWHEGWRVVGRRAGRPRWSNPVVLTRAVTVSTEHETTVDFELSVRSADLAGD